jgi:hypothetical protein
MNTTKTSTTATTERTAGLWSTVRDDLRERRAARAVRAELEEQLSSFTSASDIEDLLATAERYDNPGAATIREILSTKLAHVPGSYLAG